MSAPFGFSVGDFLAVISLVFKICQALDNASGSVAEFRDVKQQLKSFGHVVDGLQKAGVDPSTISSENAALLPEILQSCTEALNDFQSFLSSYNGMRTVVKKVSWVTLGKSKLEGFRSRIHANMMLLSLIQQDIQRNTLNNVKAELVQVKNDVSQEIRGTAQSLQLHVTSSLSWSYDQRPIKFQDALGRRYPVPLELCHDFQSLIEFLEFSFKNSPLLPLVTNRDLWLFTPGGEQVAWWYLLQEADWANFARPGMKLGMSFKPLGIDSACQCGFPNGASKPCDGSCNPPDSNVRFVKPLPPNSPYDPNTEFRFLTRPQRCLGTTSSILDEGELRELFHTCAAPRRTSNKAKTRCIYECAYSNSVDADLFCHARVGCTVYKGR
ncbi:hypothetical protein F5Y09DRAFT_268839 [Xylaria sp. FL1042]|nr:hypothetical protein F5Y09DRAFT_268839 [Xylaria sp. FL1042]